MLIAWRTLTVITKHLGHMYIGSKESIPYRQLSLSQPLNSQELIVNSPS